MRFTTAKKLLAATLVAIAIAAMILVLRTFRNTVAIVNQTKGTISDVELTVTSLDQSWTKTWSVNEVAAGQQSSFRDDCNDASAILNYKIGGVSYEYREAYIDLWRGETWKFVVCDGGEVESGYYHPKRN